ncbi:hypothetical protein ACIQ6Y_19735 [Streptomyces sp. NPDC096205]|uniref:hypothetical protein n=1 Tax=Streptomyces sp. NPDC096205 TaxID=3366081 RepID=UPI0037F6A6AB
MTIAWATACPVHGDLTVGGVLAVGGHGTAVPAAGEQRPDGHGYGTLRNQVTELTAVVWVEPVGRYTLRTFDRSQADTAALWCICAEPSSPRSSSGSAPTSVCAA